MTPAAGERLLVVPALSRKRRLWLTVVLAPLGGIAGFTLCLLIGAGLHWLAGERHWGLPLGLSSAGAVAGGQAGRNMAVLLTAVTYYRPRRSLVLFRLALGRRFWGATGILALLGAAALAWLALDRGPPVLALPTAGFLVLAVEAWRRLQAPAAATIEPTAVRVLSRYGLLDGEAVSAACLAYRPLGPGKTTAIWALALSGDQLVACVFTDAKVQGTRRALSEVKAVGMGRGRRGDATLVLIFADTPESRWHILLRRHAPGQTVSPAQFCRSLIRALDRGRGRGGGHPRPGVLFEARTEELVPSEHQSTQKT